MPRVILLDLSEQFGAEMEPRGGSGGGEAVFGVDCLIVGGVAQEFFDIGRGGHRADCRDGCAQLSFGLVEVKDKLIVRATGAFD